MSADTRLALGFAAFYVFGGCVMLLLGYVLRRGVVSACDGCGVVVDLDEDGGHIYGDGSVLCPQCEDGEVEG